MANGTCLVTGCGRTVFARGWCSKHYDRWRAHGDPLHAAGSHGDPASRFWAYVEKTDDCWLWTGNTNGRYGKFWNGERTVFAHRFAYELLVGPIPDGLVIDHLCCTPLCVWPDHLDPVEQQENVRRAFGRGTQ